MKNSIRIAILLSFALLQGCGWVQSLRKEIDEDNPRQPLATDYDYYKDPAHRYVPPPPANVIGDAKSEALAGTPVDLSGERAKHLRTTAQNFMADAKQNENSLWSGDGQSNYLFAQNKLKQPGDLVTVVIEDGLRKDMVDSVKRLLPPDYRDEDIVVPGLTKNAPDDPNRVPAQTADPNAAAAPSNEPGPSDMLTAEVLERYPNGNVRLRGIKRVPFKHQVRNIEVVAICKNNDIGENDTVKSSHFFDQHVEIYK